MARSLTVPSTRSPVIATRSAIERVHPIDDSLHVRRRRVAPTCTSDSCTIVKPSSGAGRSAMRDPHAHGCAVARVPRSSPRTSRAAPALAPPPPTRSAWRAKPEAVSAQSQSCQQQLAQQRENEQGRHPTQRRAKRAQVSRRASWGAHVPRQDAAGGQYRRQCQHQNGHAQRRRRQRQRRQQAQPHIGTDQGQQCRGNEKKHCFVDACW